MLLKEPNPRVKQYTISLTEEERAEIRKNKKNLSPIRKKLDDIVRRGKIRKMREEMGDPWDSISDRPIRKDSFND